MSSLNENDATDSAAEFRRDLRGDFVIVSPGRAARPYDFGQSADERRSRCPFCPGHESLTPPEVDADRPPDTAANTPGWSVRVVPNRYPAVPPEPGPNPNGAWGVHEVIIESPAHDRGLADQPLEEVTAVLTMFQRRLRAARSDPRIQFASIFKNHGADAGASLEHPHTQLLALPFVPRRIAEEVESHRRGVFARRLAQADAVASAGAVTAFCPQDARLPYEAWICPQRPEPSFEDASPTTIRETASLLRGLLAAMNGPLDSPPYHVLVYTAPFRDGDGYSWRIELVPRTVRIAGFELATGVFINQAAPEKAADVYREALGV